MFSKRNFVFLLLLGLIVFIFYPIQKEEILNLNNPNTTIVAFGDSLTASKGASKENSYPAYLSKLIGSEVINMGFSGETATNAPSHLSQLLDYHPYMVLIEFGGNDYMRGENFDASISSISTVVDAVQKKGSIAVIVDTAGPGMGEYTKAYKHLAKEKKAIFVPGILKGIFNKPQYKSDVIHPNAKGYEIIANKVYKVINPYLKR